jgi:hypothetical protein
MSVNDLLAGRLALQRWLSLFGSPFPHSLFMKFSLPLRISGLSALALAAILTGCNHDKLVSESPQPTTATANQELDAVAKAVAQALGASAEARQLLKAEAGKKFDGDFDVLYSAFAAQKPAFAQQLNEALGGTGIAGVLAHVPYLNLAVPVNIAKWNTADYTPLVTFVPAGFNEKTNTKPFKAYDKDGQVHWLDAKHAPDVPVVVVGPSERVTDAASAARWASAQNKPYQPDALQPKGTPAGSSSPSLMAPIETTPEEGGGGGGGGGGYTPPSDGTTYGNCRNDRQTEYLRSIWMEDVSEYEAWALGAPEIVLQVLVPAGMATTSGGGTIYQTTYSMSRGAIEDTWYCDLDLYFWDTARYGDAAQYVWLEQDTGDIATVEINLGYTDKTTGLSASTKVTYKIQNQDDMIGSKRMDFHLCTTSGYYTLGGGSTEFRWVLENRP